MEAEKPSVSDHLQIPLEEFDSRIRTFVPFYEEMLEQLERIAVPLLNPGMTVLDLGIGTGALAGSICEAFPQVRMVGIDNDPMILEMARARLAGREKVELLTGSFLDVELPNSNLIVASISLHHVPGPELKRRLYQRCREALKKGGSLLIADCLRPSADDLAEAAMEAWRAHLQKHYSPEEATHYLEAWAEEDTYFRLSDELEWLRAAGFEPDVIWRKDLWAVLLCV